MSSGQAVPHFPQFAASLWRSTSQPFSGLPSQSAKPALHVNPHVRPLHVAVAFAGATHGVHAAPQAAMSFVTHAPAHE